MKTRIDYLNTMGIDVWQERGASTATLEPPIAAEPVTTAAEVIASRPATQPSSEQPLTFEQLKTHISQCQLCDLHCSRTQTVFGIGNPNADLMFIGEAPGQQEDLKGEPFVGRAGQLLNAMLQAIGLKREDIFIANILKCRPPNNRDPSPEEVKTCTPYLVQQIKLIQPKVIVALGRISAQYLLDSSTSLGQLRTQTHRYQDTPLLVTYHPAYLLRAPREKTKSWQDLCQIKTMLKQ